MGVDSLATLIHFFVMMMIIIFYIKLEKKTNKNSVDKKVAKNKAEMTLRSRKETI
ncbi:hypothetical protein KUL106_01010 [Alteromonas sp. KUL106]|nr:hypothetical protein KUL106_01010 [Alteromonas sp. KUL106]